MKKITLLSFLFICLGCKAQFNIIPRYDGTQSYGKIKNAYYKDVDNQLNPYVGTWLFANGTDTLKIILKKKEYLKIGDCYSDFIVGGYQYIENGTEKLNCLNEIFDNSIIFAHDYNLYGNLLQIKGVYPLCPDCLDNERRLALNFNEPLTKDISDMNGRMLARRVVEAGVEKLKIMFYLRNQSLGYKDDGSLTTIDHHTIPYGEYILIKQP